MHATGLDEDGATLGNPGDDDLTAEFAGHVLGVGDPAAVVAALDGE
jgi:hypothetical protein